MTGRRAFGLVLDVVLWGALALVLLSANGPVRRYWDAWREQVRTRRLVESEWSRLASMPSSLGGSWDDSTGAVPAVIEFADFQCPYCSAAVDTLDIFLRRHPEAHVGFRHFPLTDIHAAAEGAARAAICAEAQGRFREIYLWLFRHDEWKRNHDWLSAARAAGVPDMNTFARCLADPGTSERVQHDLAIGRRLGVSGTPSFVSRRGLHAGAITVRELEKLTGF